MVGGKREQIKTLLKPWSPSKREGSYGEWVVMLPAYFIAFDITDDGHFVPRIKFHRIMHGSTSR